MGKSSEAAAEGGHQVHRNRDEDRCFACTICRCDLDTVECYIPQVILHSIVKNARKLGKPIRYFVNASVAKCTEQIVENDKRGA